MSNPTPTFLGPLTTSWVGAADCSLLSLIIYPSSLGYTISQYDYLWPDGTRCAPSNLPTGLDRYNHYYSPGICPSGWTSYVDDTVIASTDIAGFCCPSGYTSTNTGLGRVNTNACRMVIQDQSSVTTAYVHSGSLKDLRSRYFSIETATRVTIGPITAFAGAIVSVRNKAVGNSTANSTAPQFSSSITSEAKGTNGGMSSGAKIGLGIGIPLVLLFFGILVAFILIRKRHQSKPPTEAPRHEFPSGEGKAELPGSYGEHGVVALIYQKPELQGSPSSDTMKMYVQEIGRTHRVAELGNENHPELDTHQAPHVKSTGAPIQTETRPLQPGPLETPTDFS